MNDIIIRITSITTIKGKVCFVSFSMDIPDIPEPTKSTPPTGGVNKPIPQFRISMTPNCIGLRPMVFNTGRSIGVTMTMIGAIPRIDQVFLFLVWIYPEFYTFLHYPYYYTIYFMSIQVFGLFSITSVTSMDMSYISIAEARGFTTHLIKLKNSYFSLSFFFNSPIRIRASRGVD